MTYALDFTRRNERGVQRICLLGVTAALLSLSACADDAREREGAAGATGGAITPAEADMMRQRLALLEQRVERIESGAVVVSPPQDQDGGNVADAAGNQAAQANSAQPEANQAPQ